MSSVHKKKAGHSPSIKGSRNIGLVCDSYLEDVINEEWDMIALPGGLPGAENLAACKILVEKLKKQKEEKKWYGAICASPALVLLPNGLTDGVEVTCYPSFEKQFKNQHKMDYRVLVSHNCITSKGPGTAMEYALVIIEKLLNSEKAASVAKGLLAHIPK